MVRVPGTGTSTAGSARPAWVVPAAYTWVAGFALMHVLAIVSNGGYGAGVDPGSGDSGIGCVLPNAIVIAICCVAMGVIHRTTGPPRPFVPAWTVRAGAWIGMPLLVLRGAATAVDECLRLTGAMPYGMFDQRENATSAWAQWSGRALDFYFVLGAVVLALALGPWVRKSRRQTSARP
ncbi:hypothetical protein ABZY44_35040 [Streptomyces sp. NPDC006544]|uniref:hypothetical protein n=1 Tax=Streptomyces sp. NPDC006544 TaxID=3154583 RepID=UPI0033B59CBB